MQKIKEYLLFLRGNKVVRSKSNIVALYIAKPGRKSPNHKALEQVNLKITDNRYIKDVLVPFFKCLTFLSKKRWDYQDWVTLLRLRINGHHLTKEGKDLIALIVKGMNNKRLSTCIVKSRLENTHYINNRIHNLLISPSNIQTLKDGREKIISTGTFKSTSSCVELYDQDDLFF